MENKYNDFTNYELLRDIEDCLNKAQEISEYLSQERDFENHFLAIFGSEDLNDGYDIIEYIQGNDLVLSKFLAKRETKDLAMMATSFIAYSGEQE